MDAPGFRSVEYDFDRQIEISKARRIRNKGPGWIPRAFAVSSTISIDRSKSLNDLLAKDRSDLA